MRNSAARNRTMDSLQLKAHATLFRETAESREAVKSNGSLIHLADNPEYADVIAAPQLLDLLHEGRRKSGLDRVCYAEDCGGPR